MKAKSVQLSQAITIPGTRVLGDTSIHPEKHPETELTVIGEFLEVKSNGITALVPFNNIKAIILKDEAINGRSKQAPKESK